MPDFESREYWDKRFTKDARLFDWLVPAQSLRDIATRWIDKQDLRKADILHIGCGTSDSLQLCDLVADPRQICNVDFSQVAIDVGVAREKDASNETPAVELVEVQTDEKEDGQSQQPTSVPVTMRWSCLDLLSLDNALDFMDLQTTQRGRLFDIILDKSTSDSIACGQSLSLNLPYPLSINGWSRAVLQSGVAHVEDVHTLHVLAVHLAALTTPRTGRWIAVSYSEDRFPFFPPYPTTAPHGLLSDSVLRAGFPHPGDLWRMVAKEKIEIPPREDASMTRPRAHQPDVSHWLYVLDRTDAVVIY